MQVKKKKCKECRKPFQPFNSMTKACSVKCALALVNKEKERKFNAETRKLKAKVKTKGQWLREAQAAFNAFVRVRDQGEPCISCDKPDNGQHQRHASHFRSVGAAPHLRFNLLNVHASCSTCNNHLSGNLIEYVARLPAKIGQSNTDWLMHANFEKRYDIEYARRVKRIFSKRARIYKKLFRGD